MKVTYDLETDVLAIVLSAVPIEESDEDKPGVILDYDKDGNVVGLEILDASKRMENPQTLEYAIAPSPHFSAAPARVREKPSRRYGRK